MNDLIAPAIIFLARLVTIIVNQERPIDDDDDEFYK